MFASLFAPVLLVALGNAPASLPDVIDIATPTQAQNLFGDYAIDDGKLWHRKDASEAWALVDKTGMPNLDGHTLPEVKGKLTRVYADGNVVAVVDEARQVFRYDAALHVLDFEPTLYAWRAAWSTRPLVIRDDLRALSYGRRTILNVGVVDDRFGYKMKAANPSSLISFRHENGFSGLMHFYGLSNDGHRLFFADNGLTDVFNYEFDVPRVDDFEGVSIASSASQVVVLDTRGRLWAKFLDFDWYGCNPMMFEYSYVDDGQANGRDQSDKDPEGFGRIHVPLPTWRQLPALDLPQNAFISTEMGMKVTGQGNEARQLRIRGANAEGDCGLYEIELDKNQWHFEKTGICPHEKFVAAASAPRWKRDVDLVGDWAIDGVPYQATISGYSLVDSPARVELRNPANGRVVFRGQLHFVPAWSPLEQIDPGRDGRYKMLHITFEPDADFSSTGIARVYGNKAFAFTGYGSAHELVVKQLSDDRLSGRLRDDSGRQSDAVGAFVVEDARGVKAACSDVRARVQADENELFKMTSTTPFLNAFGLVTGTRFWYYHGISMIPPLGRMMEWGTRLLYDRWRMTQFEMQLVQKHCGDGP